MFRVEWESSFDFTGGFDPTAEYLGEAFGIYSNLLVRTLVGYNHVAGAAGNKVVPDLATNTGVVSNGGKTYTFKLKPGVKFGPPLNRAITSKDVLYAFQKLGTPSLGAEYAFYYNNIKGMSAFSAGEAKVISGIKTPDLSTISFTLNKPQGDFLLTIGDAGSRPAAAGSRGMLHEALRVRPLRHLVGPVHDRRLGQAQRLQLRHDQGRRRHLGLRRREGPRPRPQPRLQPGHGQQGRA